MQTGRGGTGVLRLAEPEGPRGPRCQCGQNNLRTLGSHLTPDTKPRGRDQIWLSRPLRERLFLSFICMPDQWGLRSPQLPALFHFWSLLRQGPHTGGRRMQSSDLGRQGQGLGEDKKAREQSGAPGHKRGPTAVHRAVPGLRGEEVATRPNSQIDLKAICPCPLWLPSSFSKGN